MQLTLKIIIYVILLQAIYVCNQSAFLTEDEELFYALTATAITFFGALLLGTKYLKATPKLGKYPHEIANRSCMRGCALILLILAAFPTLNNEYQKYTHQITSKHIAGDGFVDFIEIYMKNEPLCTIIDRSLASFEDRNDDGFVDLVVGNKTMPYDPSQKTFLNCLPLM